MSYQTPFVRRQVRKLLLFICGNKEKYRQLRDLHALISHVQVIEVYNNHISSTPRQLNVYEKKKINIFFTVRATVLYQRRLRSVERSSTFHQPAVRLVGGTDRASQMLRGDCYQSHRKLATVLSEAEYGFVVSLRDIDASGRGRESYRASIVAMCHLLQQQIEGNQGHEIEGKSAAELSKLH